MTRLFITGVSPVTLDDVTSGFNIGAKTFVIGIGGSATNDGGTVELHRLLVVFHGGQVVVCEEV